MALREVGYIPEEFSTVLRGSVAVGIVAVSGPASDLVISADDCQKEVAQFLKGADFLVDQEWHATLSFGLDVYRVSVDAPNTPRSWNDLYFICQIESHVCVFWQSEAGWAAVHEIYGEASKPYMADILELWSAIWNPDYRVYMPFTLTVNGSLNQYFMTANNTSGRVNIRRIRFDTATYAVKVDDPAWSRVWDPDYRVYMPFTLMVDGSLNQYFMAADTVAGRVDIRRIRFDAALQAVVVDDPVWSRGWDPGYTVYMPFTLMVDGSLNQYFMAADTVTGKVDIRRIRYDAALQAIIVDDPAWSRVWNPDYRIYAPFVYGGNQFFLTANTATGNVIIRQITYDTETKTIGVLEPTFDSGWAYERAEGAWRDAAIQSLGYRSGIWGLNDYKDALRKQQNTNWSYVAFVTRYAVAHVGYASAGPGRIVVQYEGKNAPPADVTFAHETNHIFGAADEYASSNCTLESRGYYLVQNRNCQNVNDHSVSCLMNDNQRTVCTWSRGQTARVDLLLRARALHPGREAVDHRPGR
jgi:hypothetical protein